MDINSAGLAMAKADQLIACWQLAAGAGRRVAETQPSGACLVSGCENQT